MPISSINLGQMVNQVETTKSLARNLTLKIVENTEGFKNLTMRSAVDETGQRVFSQTVNHADRRKYITHTSSRINGNLKNTKLIHMFNIWGERTSLICEDLITNVRRITNLATSSDGKIQKISTKIEAISRDNL